jgi:hypothetical protein
MAASCPVPKMFAKLSFRTGEIDQRLWTAFSERHTRHVRRHEGIRLEHPIEAAKLAISVMLHILLPLLMTAEPVLDCDHWKYLKVIH